MTDIEGPQRLADLYSANWRPLMGYACRRCGSVEDAADLVSDVFVVAWRRIDEIPADGARLWLFGTARRQLANQRRSRARREKLGAALVREIREAGAWDPADLFVRSEDERRLRQVLDRLSDLDQEILTLVGWEELSIAEVSVVLRIRPAAARARLSRARRRLTSLLRLNPDPSSQLPFLVAVNRKPEGTRP